LGRKIELNQVRNTLSDPDCRLLTLLGPGGIGKSRLAAQAAQAQVYTFLQGVFLVPLAGLTTQADVVRAIAGELDFQLRPAGDPKTQLLDYLRAKEMLLVLDNYEQLLGPGVPSGTSLLEDLLAHAPGLQFLVTSRQRLNLSKERVITLQGLAFPEDVLDSDPENYAAVKLFLQSARRIDPGFHLLKEDEPAIMRTCQLLEGVPLAIELAAAWVRVMSPEQIALEIESNLDFLASSYPDLPERQRSLRATFEHSFNLLTPAEQQVLCRLAIFPASFERSAAEQVADATLAVLASLCDRSLVEQVSFKKRESHPRYRLHELIRQFCSEKLRQDPVEAGQAKDRYRSFYMRFLNERNPHVMGGRASHQAVQEVGSEIENVRLALEQAIAEGHLKELGHSLNILMFFSEIHGLFAEAERIFGQISRCMQAGIHAGAAAGEESWNFPGRALMYHGWYCMHLARYDQAIELTQQGLALCRQSGDWEGYALALNSLGLIARDQGGYSQAKCYLQEALNVCEEQGFPWSQAGAASNLGHLVLLQGDLPRATELFHQALDLYIRLNDDWGKAGSLDFLGEVALRQGDLELAEQRFRQGLEIRHALDQRWRVALSLNRLGELAYRRQQYTEAKRDHQESLAILRDFGERNHLAVTLLHIGEACTALGDNMEAREAFHESLQFAQETGAEGTLVQALVGLAMLLVKEGERERSAAILAAVSGHPSIAQEKRIRAASLLEELQEVLTPQVFQAALENGKHHSLQDLVAFILTSGGLERLAFVYKSSQA
jgi:predicted ATPase/predicted negative regulator of RcsB-dependent stress response